MISLMNVQYLEQKEWKKAIAWGSWVQASGWCLLCPLGFEEVCKLLSFNNRADGEGSSNLLWTLCSVIEMFWYHASYSYIFLWFKNNFFLRSPQRYTKKRYVIEDKFEEARRLLSFKIDDCSDGEEPNPPWTQCSPKEIFFSSNPNHQKVGFCFSSRLLQVLSSARSYVKF